MTLPPIEDLRALLEAITPGEWEIAPEGSYPPDEGAKVLGPWRKNSYGLPCRQFVAQFCQGEDARAIALLPALIRRVVELEEERRRRSWDSQAVRDVLAEREAHITREGWTREHDDEHSDGEMAMAASCYAFIAGRPKSEDHFRENIPPAWWKWGREWWKPKDPRRDLVRAGFLIIAEIERLDRAAALKGGGDE